MATTCAWRAPGSGSEKASLTITAASMMTANRGAADADGAGSSSLDPNDEENQCNICLGEEGAPDTYFYPCGHKACDACVKKIRHSNIYKADKGVRCPFCRQVIESYSDQPPPRQRRPSSSGTSSGPNGSGNGNETVRQAYGRSGIVSIGDGNDYATPKNITGEAGTALKPGSRDSEWPQGYKFPTLRDGDDVVTMAFDRMGARHLDWMLRETFPKKYRVAKTCFEHLMSYSAKLAAHGTGNYVIQRMMDFAANHRGCHTEGDVIAGAYSRIVKSLTKDKGLVTLAQDPHGRFTAQRLIVSLKGEEELRLVMESIQGNMLKLAVDQFGVCLLERIVEVIIPSLNPPNPSMKPRVPPPAATKAAVQFCTELGSDEVPSVTLIKLGKHPLASILLVETIRWCLPREEGFIAARNISKLSAELAGSKGGNRLLQGILSLDVTEIAETLIMRLKGRYAGLALDYHGGGCKVVRACLATPSVDDYCRLEIVDEMLQLRSLSAIFEQPQAVDVLAFGLATLSGRMLTERLGFLAAHPRHHHEVRDLVDKYRQHIQEQGPLISLIRNLSGSLSGNPDRSISKSPMSSASFPPLAPLPNLGGVQRPPPPPHPLHPPPPTGYLCPPDTGFPNPLGPSYAPTGTPGPIGLFPPLSNPDPGTGAFNRTAAVGSAFSSESTQGLASLNIPTTGDSLNLSALTQTLPQSFKPPEGSQVPGAVLGTSSETGTGVAERWAVRSVSTSQDSGQGIGPSGGSSTYLPPHLRGSSPVNSAVTARVAAASAPSTKTENEEGLMAKDQTAGKNWASLGDDITGKSMQAGQTMEKPDLLRTRSDGKSAIDGKGREQGLCVVCNLKHINAVLMGCAHWCTCLACASKLSLCPMCDSPITGMLPVQIAADNSSSGKANTDNSATETIHLVSESVSASASEKEQVGNKVAFNNNGGPRIHESAYSAAGVTNKADVAGVAMSVSSALTSFYPSGGHAFSTSQEEMAPSSTAEPLSGSMLTRLLQPEEASGTPDSSGMGALEGTMAKPPTGPPSASAPLSTLHNRPPVSTLDQSWPPTGMSSNLVSGSGITTMPPSFMGTSGTMPAFSGMSSTEQVHPPPPLQYPPHPSHSPFPWHQGQSSHAQGLHAQQQPHDSTYRTFTSQAPYPNSSMYLSYSGLPPPRVGGNPMVYLQSPGLISSQSSVTGIPVTGSIAQPMLTAFQQPQVPVTIPPSPAPSNNSNTNMVLPYQVPVTQLPTVPGSHDHTIQSLEFNEVNSQGIVAAGSTLVQPVAPSTAPGSSLSNGGVVHQSQSTLSTGGGFAPQSQPSLPTGAAMQQSVSLAAVTSSNGSEQGAIRTAFRRPGTSLPKPAPYRPPGVYRPPM
ncbi:hypothetical protein CBR_g23531 [Chara braunii]|uniref:RING-type domain-containing protein n=1 Tax=Chara braunii TaxID=69332 RepID=A0A388L4H4_CHABU|nr:hypothetical protein CBR_g23531 [Chara braunii]|eukprot:GBG77204.1 hypothetical protein CBR_g23531 [Chara braunii]